MEKITVGGLEVLISRKDIKHLHLGVYPPCGQIRASVPQVVSNNAVRMAVIDKLSWLKRQQEGFANQERQSHREFVTGESHYVEGKRFLLDVIEEDNPPAVRIRKSNKLELRVRPGTDRSGKADILDKWYRELLKEVVPGLMAKWEKVIGVEVKDLRIKRMKTKWGSCNTEASRIWINLELAKKPILCLEYVLVHEMVHLLERNHNDRFWAYLDKFMPRWRQYRDGLNAAPLKHETWNTPNLSR